MSRLLTIAGLTAAAGCGDPSTAPSGPKAEPVIHVKESIRGDLGPVGGGRSREYQGPVTTAPDWAKPRSPAAK